MADNNMEMSDEFVTADISSGGNNITSGGEADGKPSSNHMDVDNEIKLEKGVPDTGLTATDDKETLLRAEIARLKEQLRQKEDELSKLENWNNQSSVGSFKKLKTTDREAAEENAGNIAAAMEEDSTIAALEAGATVVDPEILKQGDLNLGGNGGAIFEHKRHVPAQQLLNEDVDRGTDSPSTILALKPVFPVIFSFLDHVHDRPIMALANTCKHCYKTIDKAMIWTSCTTKYPYKMLGPTLVKRIVSFLPCGDKSFREPRYFRESALAQTCRHFRHICNPTQSYTNMDFFLEHCGVSKDPYNHSHLFLRRAYQWLGTTRVLNVIKSRVEPFREIEHVLTCCKFESEHVLQLVDYLLDGWKTGTWDRRDDWVPPANWDGEEEEYFRMTDDENTFAAMKFVKLAAYVGEDETAAKALRFVMNDPQQFPPSTVFYNLYQFGMDLEEHWDPWGFERDRPNIFQFQEGYRAEHYLEYNNVQDD